MMTKPQKRSAGWARYDPELITDWRPLPWLPSASWICSVVILAPIVSYVAALLGYTRPGYQAIDMLISGLWYSTLLAALAMYLGNSHLLLPKLLLVLVCVLAALNAYRWFQTQGMAESPKHLFNLIAACSLLFWAAPAPPGPLVNAHADVMDGEQLPPMNLGGLAVRAIGSILAVVYFLGPLFR